MRDAVSDLVGCSEGLASVSIDIELDTRPIELVGAQPVNLLWTYFLLSRVLEVIRFMFTLWKSSRDIYGWLRELRWCVYLYYFHDKLDGNVRMSLKWVQLTNHVFVTCFFAYLFLPLLKCFLSDFVLDKVSWFVWRIIRLLNADLNI